jgi:hypothetical protein
MNNALELALEALKRCTKFEQRDYDAMDALKEAIGTQQKSSREAFEQYMYGDEEPTTRIDAQKETRQHWETWQAARRSAPAIPEEFIACQKLCNIYFDIAAAVIGEKNVRQKRDAMLSAAPNPGTTSA